MTGLPRPLKIGIGGPVGSGKTALVETLSLRLRDHFDMAVITNDIYTQEDAQFLIRRGALPAERVVGVETGGCPHTAIREDASVNLEAVHGLLSTGVSLGVAPVAEEEQALLVMWDGTTQDGVKETMAKPRYVFRSTDNECEAVMGSLLAIKYFKGKFKRVAGINPDYSYGRNNWEAFRQILSRYGIEAEFVAEQWPKGGTMDLTSHIAALKAAKPDLIFSSMLFADLPVFMKQGHAAGLFDGVKMVLPAAGWQINQLKKEFMPEGVVFGHNTLYFDHPQASALQKAFVADYMDRYKEAPHWEADRAYFALATYKAGVEAAQKAASKWPTPEQVAQAMPGLEVESLGGKGRFRKDKIAEQVFYQGPSTNTNKYDFPTLASIDTFQAEQLQKPPGADFWEWIKSAKMPV